MGAPKSDAGQRLSEPAPSSRTETLSGAGPSDATLVVAAQAGETWAQEAIFRRHAPMVNRLAYRLMAGDGDVDDVVQDVFVAALDQMRRLEDPAALAGWLRSIVVGVVHKRVRRARLLRRLGFRKGEEVDFDTIVSPNAPTDVRAEILRIYRAAEALPPAARTALILHRIEGRTLSEVAQALDVSLATAKRRLSDAEHALRGGVKKK